MTSSSPRYLRPRGGDLDTWPLVRYVQSLILDPATPELVMSVDHVLDVRGARPASERARIRAALARHLAPADRPAAALHIALAIPMRVARRWWPPRGVATMLALGALVVSRSPPLALATWGWSVLALGVVHAARSRQVARQASALRELERIRLLTLGGDFAAALAVWRRLEVRAAESRAVTDIVLDACGALSVAPVGTLTPEERDTIAERMEALQPHATVTCAEDARPAVDRLRRGAPW